MSTDKDCFLILLSRNSLGLAFLRSMGTVENVLDRPRPDSARLIAMARFLG
jgi:hypothetical protein